MDDVGRPFFDTRRGRLIALLRERPLTADDLAAKLHLTRSAVRLHLADMERDGIVARAGKRRGLTRPAIVFELTEDVERLLSKAYLPVLMQLVQLCVEELPAPRLQALLRETGRRLARELASRPPGTGRISARVAAASTLLNEHLGALTHVEANGHYVIRGAGCPLAALTSKHPGVCLAVESLVSEIVGAPVAECCDRSGRPRCCFEIPKAGGRLSTTDSADRRA